MLKKIIYLFLLPLITFAQDLKNETALHIQAHEMQHGFILSENDTFGSHLVANGYHSRQTEVIGELTIEDLPERNYYQERKSLNTNNGSYFLLLAQHVDLANVKPGQVLSGPIVESAVGKYEPQNIIVKQAQFQIHKILLNVENPFFGE